MQSMFSRRELKGRRVTVRRWVIARRKGAGGGGVYSHTEGCHDVGGHEIRVSVKWKGAIA